MRKKVMRTLLIVMLACVALGLTGCLEAKLEKKTVGEYTLSVPDDYDDFSVKEGYNVAGGPGGSITIQELTEADTAIGDWTEEAIQALLEQSYENLKIESVKNDKTKSGAEGVYVKFTGKSNGDDWNVNMLILFTDDSQFSVSYVMNKKGEDCSTATFADDIIKSIDLK